MAQLYHNIGHIALMLALLVCSAFFSGCETAYFSLSRRQVELLKKDRNKLQNLAARILQTPAHLLTSILFGNMMVNVLFYAITSIVTVRIEQQAGIVAAVATASLAFAALVLLGEIFPKTIAYANSKPIVIFTALPLFLYMKIFLPLQLFFKYLIVEPTFRLLLGPARQPESVTTDEFRLLIEQTQRRGLITTDENRLLAQIIELSSLKVRDCLVPRVDMLACSVTDSPQQACKIMQENNLTKLPVYVKNIDEIVGQIYLRQILLHPDSSLDKLVQKIYFIPEQKDVESLLEFFRKSHTDTAIVVDEYGGIAGSISLEDIAEELLGPIETTQDIEPIEQISDNQYRLAGDLAIHDWAVRFKINLSENRISTIAGLVTMLLGKIPKTGDITHLKNLKFTVEKMQKRRIETVILALEPEKNNDN